MSEKLSLKNIFFSFRNFPATLISIWLFTLFLTINLNSNQDFLGSFLLFLFFYGMGSFLIEAYFLKKNRGKWFYIALSLPVVPALLFSQLPTILFRFLDIYEGYATESNWSPYYMRSCVCLALILFLLGIYFCYKSCGNTVGQYLVQVFSKTARYHIIYFILMIGVTLICAILVTLFDLDFEVLMSAEMLLFGFYFMSAFLLSFYPNQEEGGLITAVMVKYVLSSMILISFAIIYAYIFKILILWDIPSNALFRITAVLFFIMMPLCLMNRAYEDNNPLSLIMKWLPCLFVPFLFLQAYSIGIRIIDNGITPLRYAAVAFLIFECITLVVYFFFPKKISLLLPAAAVIIFLCCFAPYINMNQVSFYSQKAMLEHYLNLPKEMQKTLLTADVENDDTRSRIRGAYSYLKWDHLGEIYLNKMKEDDRQTLQQLADYEYEYDYDYDSDSIDYFAKKEAVCINVSGYSSCYPIDLHEYYWDRSDEDAKAYNEFLSAYPLRDDVNPLLNADLYKLFSFYREHADDNDSIDDYFMNHYTYELDKEHTLYMTVLSFTYDEMTETFPAFRLEGYVLEK